MLRSVVNGAAINAVRRSRVVGMSATDTWSFSCNIKRVVEMQAASSWAWTINASATKLSSTAATDAWSVTTTGALFKVMGLAGVDAFGWVQTATAIKTGGLAAGAVFTWNQDGTAILIRTVAAVDAWSFNDFGAAYQSGIRTAAADTWTYSDAANGTATKYLAADSTWICSISTPTLARFVRMGGADSWSWTTTGAAGKAGVPTAANDSWAFSSAAEIDNNPFENDPPSRTFDRPYQEREFQRWAS